MVDLQVLRDRGITQESLQSRLSGDPLNKSPGKGLSWENPSDMTEREKIQTLLNRIRSRIMEGQTRNLSDFKLYYALDQAWDTSFRQITPTLLSTFIDSDPNNETVYKTFQDWGLTSMITDIPDPNTPGKTMKQLNLPTFFNVFVPLAKSYATIRRAKIMNDRRRTPFFKYEPSKLTTELSLKCDVITDRVQLMSTQYGYYNVMDQAVLKMLLYGMCLQFPKEEWHSEEQVRKASKDDVSNGKKNADGEAVKEDEEIVVTDREGIRYEQPHPTRTFWDMAHGPYTFNYDSGCQFGGYWRITRYRDVQSGPFWNKDRIALGTTDLTTANSLFFNSVYPAACTMRLGCLATPVSGPPTAASIGTGAGQLDREKEIANLYYGTDQGDQGVMVTEYFEKLIPKDNGLGDYEYPVWFRFMVAGDGCTVLYAAPLPYAPIIYYGYDADESRSKNASMVLEILPFQDQFSNLLSQIVLTAKQNLANMVLIDEDQVSGSTRTKIENIGERLFRFLNVGWFSSKKAFKGLNKVSDAVQSFQFPKGNTAELMNVLKTILDVLERVLVMSSQEVGQSASHEQTREEIKNISANTSSRLVFTSTPIDVAQDAWKRQLYHGLMAYGDEDFYVNIPGDLPLDKKTVEAMGFTYVDFDTASKSDENGKKPRWMRVRIPKRATAIPLWEIASTRDNEDRTNNDKIAATLGTILQGLLNNPITAQAIGADQAIDFTNRLAYFAGLPRDFKFTNATPNQTPEQQQAEAQAQLQQMIQTVLQQVNQSLQKELQPLLDETKKNSGDLAIIMPRVMALSQAAGMMAPTGQGQPTPTNDTATAGAATG